MAFVGFDPATATYMSKRLANAAESGAGVPSLLRTLSGRDGHDREAGDDNKSDTWLLYHTQKH